MLNIGGAELVVILLVALVVLGPERLPDVARQVGRTVESLRSMARSFQSEFEAAARPNINPPGAEAPPRPGTDPFAVAAKARAVNTEAAAAGAAEVADGGPTDLVGPDRPGAEADSGSDLVDPKPAVTEPDGAAGPGAATGSVGAAGAEVRDGTGAVDDAQRRDSSAEAEGE